MAGGAVSGISSTAVFIHVPIFRHAQPEYSPSKTKKIWKAHEELHLLFCIVMSMNWPAFGSSDLWSAALSQALSKRVSNLSPKAFLASSRLETEWQLYNLHYMTIDIFRLVMNLLARSFDRIWRILRRTNFSLRSILSRLCRQTVVWCALKFSSSCTECQSLRSSRASRSPTYNGGCCSPLRNVHTLQSHCFYSNGTVTVRISIKNLQNEVRC